MAAPSQYELLTNAVYAALKSAGKKACVAKDVHGHYTVIRTGYSCSWDIKGRGVRVNYEIASYELRRTHHDRSAEYHAAYADAIGILRAAGIHAEISDLSGVLVPYPAAVGV